MGGEWVGVLRGGAQVVAYDFGIKTNILRRLTSAGCKVTVVPAAYPADKVLDMKPDGIFLSNGPVRPPPPSSPRPLILISPLTHPACVLMRCCRL